MSAISVTNESKSVFNTPAYTDHGYNRFDLSHTVLDTMQYAELLPRPICFTVPGDDLEVEIPHVLESDTLGSPLFSGLTLKKDIFHVPYRILMPHNWEKFLTVPDVNEDIPNSVKPILNVVFLAYKLNKKISNLSSPTMANSAVFINLAHRLCLLNWFGSHGIFPHMGYNLDEQNLKLLLTNAEQVLNTPYKDGTSIPYSACLLSMFGVADTPDLVYQSFGNSAVKCSAYCFRYFPRVFIDYCHNNNVSETATHDDALNVTLPTGFTYSTFAKSFVNLDVAIPSNTSEPMYKDDDSNKSEFINILPFVAYKAITSHFYTNDGVDSIFSFQQYMSNMEVICERYSERIIPTESGPYIIPDVFSEFNLRWILRTVSPFGLLEFFYNVFDYDTALKYGDYFTTSNVKPLAGADYGSDLVTIPVNSNKVNVYDVRHALSMQKFLNTVNRIGSRLIDYSKGIFGVVPNDAVKMFPEFILRASSNIDANGVTSTGDVDSLGTRVALAQSTDQNIHFNYRADEFGVLLMLYHIDANTSYSTGIDRHLLHLDRYDMFNPYLENLGDQEIKTRELINLPYSEKTSYDSIFGYQMRYAEYKHANNVFLSNFRDGYRSWVVGYGHEFGSSPYDVRSITKTLSPDFIHTTEFDIDNIFKANTGISPNHRSQFKVKFTVTVNASRKINYQSSIV